MLTGNLRDRYLVVRLVAFSEVDIAVRCPKDVLPGGMVKEQTFETRKGVPPAVRSQICRLR